MELQKMANDLEQRWKRIIGENISRVRKGRSFTQEELLSEIMKKTGIEIAGPTLSRWEQGHTMPRMGNLTLLAVVLDVSVDELLLEPKSLPPSPGPGEGFCFYAVAVSAA